MRFPTSFHSSLFSPGCSRDYTRKGDLTRHQKEKHESSAGSFLCPELFCPRGIPGEGFGRMDHLTKHLKSAKHNMSAEQAAFRAAEHNKPKSQGSKEKELPQGSIQSYSTAQGGYAPNGGSPFQSAYLQGDAYPHLNGFPQHGAYPHLGGYPEQDSYPQQGVFLQPGGYMQQGGFPDQDAFPQHGGYPQQGSYPLQQAYFLPDQHDQEQTYDGQYPPQTQAWY